MKTNTYINSTIASPTAESDTNSQHSIFPACLTQSGRNIPCSIFNIPYSISYKGMYPDQLVKIADFLSNRCNIVLEDYQDAVEWYEAVIADPPSFPDSLFAIIDLGYLYLQMENSGLKSAVAASMPQYNPASKAEHSDYKDYLISLLYRKTKQEQPLVEGLNGEKMAMLYPNTPNPFTGSTAINYELAKDCRVMLRIYDHTGRTIKEVDQGYKAAGKHQQTIDLQSLCPGMYLCSLEANGIIAGTQKLLKVE